MQSLKLIAGLFWFTQARIWYENVELCNQAEFTSSHRYNERGRIHVLYFGSVPELSVGHRWICDAITMDHCATDLLCLIVDVFQKVECSCHPLGYVIGYWCQSHCKSAWTNFTTDHCMLWLLIRCWPEIGKQACQLLPRSYRQARGLSES